MSISVSVVAPRWRGTAPGRTAGDGSVVGQGRGDVVNKARSPYPPRGAFGTRPPTDAVEAGGEVGEITALVEEPELGVPHTAERSGESVSSWRELEGEGESLALEAGGREVGAKQVVSELLGHLFERLLEAAL